jgi:hypothetical protein
LPTGKDQCDCTQSCFPWVCRLTLGSWYSHGVTSDDACGVRGRKLTGEPGLDWWWPLPIVLLRELPRLRCARIDCASVAYGAFKLVSEFWRSSAGKSSPKTFCSLLWKPPLLKLDLDPVLLTVVALATDGRLSSFSGKPMLSSLLPVPGRPSPGDSCATSSLESLKKLLQTLFAMLAPFGAEDHGAACELALVAVGGFRDIDGTLAPDVSNTASCFRWSPKALGWSPSQLGGLWDRCEGSFGGGVGGTVPGDISELWVLHDGVSRGRGQSRCTSGSETGRDKAGALCSPTLRHHHERDTMR